MLRDSPVLYLQLALYAIPSALSISICRHQEPSIWAHESTVGEMAGQIRYVLRLAIGSPPRFQSTHLAGEEVIAIGVKSDQDN